MSGCHLPSIGFIISVKIIWRCAFYRNCQIDWKVLTRDGVLRRVGLVFVMVVPDTLPKSAIGRIIEHATRLLVPVRSTSGIWRSLLGLVAARRKFEAWCSIPLAQWHNPRIWARLHRVSISGWDSQLCYWSRSDFVDLTTLKLCHALIYNGSWGPKTCRSSCKTEVSAAKEGKYDFRDITERPNDFRTTILCR